MLGVLQLWARQINSYVVVYFLVYCHCNLSTSRLGRQAPRPMFEHELMNEYLSNPRTKRKTQINTRNIKPPSKQSRCDIRTPNATPDA
ncbi:hypothetical protein FJTKL_01679 [Diaporthe vaccinii]|uniref:Secreted protein n=1 Tax=Diaporthe vaccinii TaxID=105482 RepID=A0ABR4E028_9PEZI